MQCEAAAEEPWVGQKPMAFKKGAWTKDEDDKLIKAVEKYGSRNWVSIEKYSGVARPAKNCRLRWLNYLRPNLKKHPFTDDEEKLILQLHAQYGNSWSRIAAKLPGRSDNEIKNFWHKRAKKCRKHHLPIYPPDIVTTEANVSQPSPRTTTSSFAEQTPLCTSSIPTWTQNLLMSPDQITGLSEMPVLLNPNTAAAPAMSMQTSPMWKCGSANSYAFMPNGEPPILSFPQGRIEQLTDDHNQFNSIGQPMARSDSSMSMPWPTSSAMESPTSAKEFGSPCQVPPVYSSSQITTQVTDGPVALFSATSVLDDLWPSEPCFQSNIPISNSTVWLKQSPSSREMARATNSTVWVNSSNASIPLSTAHLKRSSSNRELPKTLAMMIEKNHTVPMYDLPPIHDPPVPLIKFGTTHSSVHQLESDKQLLNELLEAEARVRFLKKRLKIRRISTEESFLNKFNEENNLYCGGMRTEDPIDKYSRQSTSKDSLSCTCSRTNSSCTNLLISNAPHKSLSIEEMHTEASRKSNTIETSNTAILQDMQKFEKGEDSEGGEHSKRSLGLENARDSEELDTKTFQEEDFTMKSSTKSQDDRQPTNSFHHVNSQSSIIAPNSFSWDTKPCLFQFPIDESMEACSTIGDFFSEYSTSLQDSLLGGDMFGKRSGLEHPLSYQRHTSLIESSGPVYSPSTTIILEESGNERYQTTHFQSDGGIFDDNLRPEFSDDVEGKYTDRGFVHAEQLAKSLACQSTLLQQQYAANLQESSYQVRNQLMGGQQLNLAQPENSCESSLPLNQYPETRQPDFGYLVNKQDIEQEFPECKHAFIQTSDGGKSANMSTFSNSTWTPDQHSGANLESFQYLVTDFEQGYEKDSNETPTRGGVSEGGMKATGCISGEIWEKEQCLDSLSTQSLWPEKQLASHNQPFLTNTSESAVNQSTRNKLLEESMKLEQRI